MTDLTWKEIARLKALAEKATKMPWFAAAGPSSIVGWPVVAPHMMGRSVCNISVGHDESADNAAFIPAACNAVPALIALVEELAEALAKSNERLRDYMAVQQQRMWSGAGNFSTSVAAIDERIGKNSVILARMGEKP